MSCFCFGFSLRGYLRNKFAQLNTLLCGKSDRKFARRRSMVSSLGLATITGATLTSASTTRCFTKTSSTSETNARSTNLSREELVEFRSQFQHDYPAGVITKKQFVKMSQQFNPIEKSRRKKRQKFFEYVFKAVDKDSNNKIEFTDFALVLLINSFGDLKEQINLAFKIYDLDKNGVIDKNEIFAVIEALFDLYGVPEYERKDDLSPRYIAEQTMAKLDANNDQVIEFEEFLDGCMTDQLVRKILIDPMFKF